MKYPLLSLLIPCVLFACTSKVERSTSNVSQEESHAHVVSDESSFGDYADSVNTGLISPDTYTGSPRRMAMATLSGNHVHIEYGSPGVRGRIIWGGLVAYDEVWAAGAHNATSINFSQDISIDNQIIPAGKYGFFIIPGKETWTLILNKNYDQHLADDYNEKDDIFRYETQPEDMGYEVPRLTYEVIELGEGRGLIEMAWENVKVSLPFYNEEGV